MLEMIMQNKYAIKRPIDLNIINVNEPDEIQYWIIDFGVSAEMILEAVSQVGPSTQAVRRRLRIKNEYDKWM